MATVITIRITEDEAPDGCVHVDQEIEGIDIDELRHDGELPPALLLAGAMLRLVDQLPSGGGSEPPPRGATGDRMI